MCFSLMDETACQRHCWCAPVGLSVQQSTDLEIRVTHRSTDGSLYRPCWRILEQAHLISTKHWLCLFSLPLARRPVVYLFTLKHISLYL